MGAKKWSDEEIAIARDILASGKTVKAMAHLLPGRPIGGIKCMVTKLAGDEKKKRGDTQWLWTAIERELKQNPGQTIEELRIKFDCSQNMPAMSFARGTARVFMSRTGRPISVTTSKDGRSELVRTRRSRRVSRLRSAAVLAGLRIGCELQSGIRSKTC
jgi:hypothetical protein